DLPGGMGGKDLYFSKLVNGKWTEPQNMGESINTRGDEMFPTVQSDGTLYYSSDGLGGLGGLDIYRVNIAANGGYMVENVGYPINSSKDDFGLIYLADYRTAYLSSNRYNGRGDDILEVVINPLRAGKLVKEQPLLIDDFETGDQLNEVPAREVRQNDTAVSTTDIYKEEKVVEDSPLKDKLPTISDGKAVSIALKGRLLDKNTALPINNQTVELLDQTSGQSYQFTTNHDGTFTFIVPKNNVHKLRSFTPNGEEAQVLSLNYINTSINDLPAEIVLFGELPVAPQVFEEHHDSVPQPLTHLGKGGIYGMDIVKETANNTPVAVSNPDNLPISMPTLTFKVQVSAFKSHRSKINYSFFDKLPIPYVKETTDAIRFTSGNFTTLAEAEAYCNQLRAIPSYNDAFVVVYINGKRSSKNLDELVQEYKLRSIEPNR
ncbi:MAG TPA: SPOR domain-containing protein, partial [Chitinophagales bacterium]|nr:SPOR domain-containing protein [Chitinophagales bacterium]